jgi:hypothetical protein
MLACSGATGGEARTRGTPSEEGPARTEPAPPAAGEQHPRREPSPGSVCDLALACCRAYTSAVPDVVESSACAGVYEALDLADADARCERMRTGWRSAFEHLDVEVPESCR